MRAASSSLPAAGEARPRWRTRARGRRCRSRTTRRSTPSFIIRRCRSTRPRLAERAEHHDPTAAADHPDRVGERVGRPADALDHHLGAVLLAPRDRLVLAEHGDADALGGGALVRVARGDGHLGGAVARDQRGAQADGAGAEHEHLAVGLARRPSPTPRTVTASGSVSDAVTASTPSGIGARFSSGASTSSASPPSRPSPMPGPARPQRLVRPVRQNDAGAAGDVRRHRVAHVGEPAGPSTTMPASSWPGDVPSGRRRWPCQKCRSDPQMPHASTRSRTQPSRSGPGSCVLDLEPVLGPHGAPHARHRRRLARTIAGLRRWSQAAALEPGDRAQALRRQLGDVDRSADPRGHGARRVRRAARARQADPGRRPAPRRALVGAGQAPPRGRVLPAADPGAAQGRRGRPRGDRRGDRPRPRCGRSSRRSTSGSGR